MTGTIGDLSKHKMEQRGTGMEFLDYVGNYQFLTKDYAPWTCLGSQSLHSSLSSELGTRPRFLRISKTNVLAECFLEFTLSIVLAMNCRKTLKHDDKGKACLSGSTLVIQIYIISHNYVHDSSSRSQEMQHSDRSTWYRYPKGKTSGPIICCHYVTHNVNFKNSTNSVFTAPAATDLRVNL